MAAPPHSIADGVERRLDPRLIPVERAAGWIVWAVLSLPAFGLAALAGFWAPAGVLLLLVMGAASLSGLLAWLAHAWPVIQHRHAAYTVDEAGIEIRTGVAWRRTVNVARSRVQHTDVSQGPLERHFGLATLRIFTAGTDHAEVALPGLDHAIALRIRDHLIAGRSDDDAV